MQTQTFEHNKLVHNSHGHRMFQFYCQELILMVNGFILTCFEGRDEDGLFVWGKEKKVRSQQPPGIKPRAPGLSSQLRQDVL